MSEEEKKGFAVADRRHFHVDGSARETNRESSQEHQESASRSEIGERSPGEKAGREPSGAPIDFSQFLVSIAAQAGMLLRPASDDGKEQASDPEGARQIISILEMLQEKTEGRRSPEETQLLDQLLYELRMAYVAVCRMGGT